LQKKKKKVKHFRWLPWEQENASLFLYYPLICNQLQIFFGYVAFLAFEGNLGPGVVVIFDIVDLSASCPSLEALVDGSERTFSVSPVLYRFAGAADSVSSSVLVSSRVGAMVSTSMGAVVSTPFSSPG
jgi:hypothetical protein